MPLPAPASQKTSRSRAAIAAACSGVELGHSPFPFSSLLQAERALEPADRLERAVLRADSAERVAVDVAPAHPCAVRDRQLARRPRASRRTPPLRGRRPGPRRPCPSKQPAFTAFRLDAGSLAGGGPRRRRAAGRGRRSGRGRGARARRACRAGAGACPRWRSSWLRAPSSRSCSRAEPRGFRPARRRSGRSGRAARSRPASSSPGSSVLLGETEAALEQVGPRPQDGGGVGLLVEERLDLDPQPRQRQAAVRRLGRLALGDHGVEQLVEAALPAADVSGPRDAVLARAAPGRRGRARRGRRRPATAGLPRARAAAGASSCATNHWYEHWIQPSSEPALRRRRSPSASRTAGWLSGPGLALWVGDRRRQAQHVAGGGKADAERAEQLAPAIGVRPRAERHRAGQRSGVVASVGAGTDCASDRVTFSSPSAWSVSSRSSTSSTNGERAAGWPSSSLERQLR